MRVGKSNPPEKARINAMNARIKSMDGTVRFRVDPKNCPYTVRDFEGVRVLDGTAGELDKTDTKLTHLSDGIGYYIAEKYPIFIDEIQSSAA